MNVEDIASHSTVVFETLHTVYLKRQSLGFMFPQVV